MNIYWLGENCVKIEGKSATVVVDPFSSKEGKMPKTGADILLLSRPFADKDMSFIKSDAFVVDTPGEYESRDVFMHAALADEQGELAYRFTVDDITFGYTGNTSSVNNDTSDLLEGVDILIIPAGGDGSLSPESAAKATNVIEARIVIPVHLKTKGMAKRATGADFAKELGLPAENSEPKLVIKKKDLPVEDMRLVILEA
jgi:L-ascorbate metabolism protein UlaG (beta-lactamase superfamily)